jgi:hypothetical protein
MEPLDVLQNYRGFHGKYTEPLNILRNYQGFRGKYTELGKNFVEKLRNLVKSAKLKKVRNKNQETIFISPNLK